MAEEENRFKNIHRLGNAQIVTRLKKNRDTFWCLLNQVSTRRTVIMLDRSCIVYNQQTRRYQLTAVNGE